MSFYYLDALNNFCIYRYIMYQLPGGIVIQTGTETQSTDTDTDGEENECSYGVVVGYWVSPASV